MFVSCQHTNKAYCLQIRLVIIIMVQSDELTNYMQAIDFNVTCYEKYCIHNERKNVLKVICNTRMLDVLMTI